MVVEATPATLPATDGRAGATRVAPDAEERAALLYEGARARGRRAEF
jgi:hypothetical protein